MAASKTLAYHYVEGVLVSVQSASDPSEEEWDAYLKYFSEHAKGCTKTLVVTYGGGPNAGMRNRMNQKIKGVPMMAAVCTNSTVVRGIVTALNWFNPRIKAFERDDTPAALTYLGVPAAAIPRLLHEVSRLRVTLPEVA